MHGPCDDWLLALPCVADGPTSLELFDDVMTPAVLIKSTHKTRKKPKLRSELNIRRGKALEVLTPAATD